MLVRLGQEVQEVPRGVGPIVRGICTVAAAVVAVIAPSAASAAVPVQLITGGRQSDAVIDKSLSPSISADGRYIAFASRATNLVGGDRNYATDVFVYDHLRDRMRLASVASNGRQGNHPSFRPRISANGRYVSFVSAADNLVRGDDNDARDVFVHDLRRGGTVIASLGDGGQLPDDGSSGAAISADGRYVTFDSFAENLDPHAPDDSNVYVRDLRRGTTTLASGGLGGPSTNSGLAPSISDDGRRVAFESFSPQLVPGDTNGDEDVFVRDLGASTTTRASVTSSGAQADSAIHSYSYGASISADGRHVGFLSSQTNLVGASSQVAAFVRDLDASTTSAIPFDSSGGPPLWVDTMPALSADGGRVVVISNDQRFGFPGSDTHVYVFDRAAGTLTRLDQAPDGTPANGSVKSAAVSADGRFVAFSSNATNLDHSDREDAYNIFVAGPIP
jgi:Tol biopolymer transport system component